VWRITQFELVSTRKATWSSCFPFFARSSLKDEPLPQGPIAISHLPIMTTDVRVKKPVAEVLNEIKATPWKAQQKKAGSVHFGTQMPTLSLLLSIRFELKTGAL